jgi:uncharacterized protein YmfQ (DUF2313 family)
LLNQDVLKLLFPLEIGGVLEDDLGVDGRSLDTCQGRAEAVLDEMFADIADELLDDWERVCNTNPGDDWPDAMRTAHVLKKLRETGDIKRPYFVLLAASLDLGYQIEIEDLQPLMAGWMRAGDTCYIADAVYIWKVSVLNQPLYYFRAGEHGAGDRVTWYLSNIGLEDILNDLKPAEVFLWFVYP